LLVERARGAKLKRFSFNPRESQVFALVKAEALKGARWRLLGKAANDGMVNTRWVPPGTISVGKVTASISRSQKIPFTFTFLPQKYLHSSLLSTTGVTLL
jgi:hypothetical protein